MLYCFLSSQPRGFCHTLFGRTFSRLLPPKHAYRLLQMPQFWSIDNSGVILPGMTTSAVHNTQSQRSSEKMPSTPSQSTSQNASTSWYSPLRSSKNRCRWSWIMWVCQWKPSGSQLHQQQTPNSVRKSAYQIPARVAMEQSFYIYI